MDKVSIVWSFEDIQALIPSMSDEEAKECLSIIGRSLKERSIEQGWEILETLLLDENYEIENVIEQ
jgi:hypothetical protein